MRTTITLDGDVSARLDAIRRKRRQRFKTVVNDALRAGLDALERPAIGRGRPFRTEGFDLGPSLVGSLDNIEEVLSRAEGERHR